MIQHQHISTCLAGLAACLESDPCSCPEVPLAHRARTTLGVGGLPWSNRGGGQVRREFSRNCSGFGLVASRGSATGVCCTPRGPRAGPPAPPLVQRGSPGAGPGARARGDHGTGFWVSRAGFARPSQTDASPLKPVSSPTHGIGHTIKHQSLATVRVDNIGVRRILRG